MFSKTIGYRLLLVAVLSGSAGWGYPAPPSIRKSQDLKSALQAAKTSEDHLRIAAYPQDQAKQLREKSNKEEELASYYQEHAINYSKKYPTPYQNAEHLANYYSWAAGPAEQKAATQSKLAAQAEAHPSNSTESCAC
jgi:hypothetical protein